MVVCLFVPVSQHARVCSQMLCQRFSVFVLRELFLSVCAVCLARVAC